MTGDLTLGQLGLDTAVGEQLDLLAQEPEPGAPDSEEVLDEVRQSIDSLVRESAQYRTTAKYREFLHFVGSFRTYSPYNVMLAHLQKQGCRYLATSSVWRERYGHAVAPNAQPIVILRPRGPVLVVYDVSDVEPLGNARPLPSEVTDPLGARFSDAGSLEVRCRRLEENLRGMGIRVLERPFAAGYAGDARRDSGRTLERSWPARGDRPAMVEQVPLRYTVVINQTFDAADRYATLVHEAAHVLCGHLGSPDEKWWPARSHVDKAIREFEAESTAFVVARRIDSDARFPAYLDRYLTENDEVPDFSLERVAVVSRKVENLSTSRYRSARRSETLPS